MTWLFALAVVTHLGPELIAQAFGHARELWEYLLYGIEATALWLVIGAHAKTGFMQAVSAYGFAESVQRPLCRAMFPLDRPPEIPAGSYLCDAAGVQTSGLSTLAVCVVLMCWRSKAVV